MLGYCMKDLMKYEFEMIDHNITAKDMNIGMKQYILYGLDENKNWVILTLRNFADKVFNWTKRNCHHPIVVNFVNNLYPMLRTKKYYPSSMWVVGGYGWGYNPVRTQSLYLMMVVL